MEEDSYAWGISWEGGAFWGGTVQTIHLLVVCCSTTASLYTVQYKFQENHLESYTVWLILPSLYKSLVVVVAVAPAAAVVVIAVTLLCVLLELRCNKCWNASTTTDVDFDSCLRLRIFVQQNCWENSPITPPPAVSLLRFSPRFLPPLALLRMCVVDNSSGGAIAVVAAGAFSPLDRLI